MGAFCVMPRRGTGWSFLDLIWLGGADVPIGVAKISTEGATGGAEVNRALNIEVVGVRVVVGFEMELVRIGWVEGRPEVARLV
jgi:hypothetical protein